MLMMMMEVHAQEDQLPKSLRSSICRRLKLLINFFCFLVPTPIPKSRYYSFVRCAIKNFNNFMLNIFQRTRPCFIVFIFRIFPSFFFNAIKNSYNIGPCTIMRKYQKKKQETSFKHVPFARWLHGLMSIQRFVRILFTAETINRYAAQ